MFQEKVCTKCEEKKSANGFHKDKSRRDGYSNWCKVCCKEYQQSEAGKKAYNQANEKYRQSDKGREARIRYSSSDKGKRIRQQYDASNAGRKVILHARKKFWQSLKGKQSKKRHSAIRRTHKTKAGGLYTQSQWYKLCKFYDFHCLRCDKQFFFEELTLDHIRPVSKGGSSNIFNIQPLCKPCNSKKGNKEIDYRKFLPDWIDRDASVWIQDTLF